MKKWASLIIFGYCLFLLLFSVYTYSQIDLNLTLSGNPFYQLFQNKLIYLGYYNRPLSALIYILLIIISFIFYFLFIKASEVKNFHFKKIFIPLIIINIIFALVSYPAFSHDFFNYLFDARIAAWYHLNPYFYKALDFPDDLWIRFMHWTHRTYPYGPVWLLITLPFSFLGFGKFVITVVLFKIMFSLSYLANSYLVWLISGNINKEYQNKAAIMYAFNPLIIIESLVSPHNESLMLSFLLLSFYFILVKKSKASALIWLIFSAGVKFVTAVLFPLYLIKKIFHNNKLFLQSAFVLLLVPLGLEIFYREAYPWYFIPLVGVGALIHSTFYYKIIVSVSLGALLRYSFFLYYGEYNQSDYLLMDLLLITPLIFAILSSILPRISSFRKALI